jgi:hypothetical protein
LFRDLPAPPRPVLLFHTVGYNTLHLCTPRRISEQRHECDEAKMQFLLQKGGFPAARAVNCLGFKDPNPISNHYGTNPRVMAGLFRQEDVMVALFKHLHVLYFRGAREFYFYCRSGNHRSVALAEMCAYVYNQSGRASATVDHKMQWRWPSFKCGVCRACGSDREGYQESVAEHYEKFRALTRSILE